MVLKFDASSLPVCLVTVKGDRLYADPAPRPRRSSRFATRSRCVKGAEIPPPFGGKYRQVMVYVDPYKLLARQLSPMDVVNAVNESNLILPAGDVKVGPYDYYVYSNSLVEQVDELNERADQDTAGQRWVSVGDVGEAEGRQPDPIQHRARGRAAIRLPSDHEAGRRHQHHRGGERHPRT